MHIMEKSGRECSPAGKRLNQYGNEIDKIVDIDPLVRSVRISTDRTDAISRNPKESNRCYISTRRFDETTQRGALLRNTRS